MSEFETAVPHDRSAEIAVLAACFQSPVACERALKVLSPGDFFQPAHEALLVEILRLRREGTPVDHVTLGDRLRSLGVQAGPTLALLPDLATAAVVPEEVDHHAGIVRNCAIRRRVLDLCTSLRQRAVSPEDDAASLPTQAAAEFNAIGQAAADDIDTRTLGEILDTDDPPYDWIVPGLLERGDRLVLTGYEGLGKSTFLRQVGILPAAGLHPFRPRKRVLPIKTHYFEFENNETHVRRQVRGLVAQARRLGDDPRHRVAFDFRSRVNLLRDRDLSWVHRCLDATQPDLVVMGPVYRMFSKAINSDEDAAEVLAVLDGIRARGVALVVEAHSGHTKSATGNRDLRPRGSSALMGWPEFGYGLRPHREVQGAVQVIDWRGDRDTNRDWPRELGKGGLYPWTDLNYNTSAEEAA